MNAPAVSVILPAYNCEKHIGQAIKSVMEQTFPDFELIILNDGSTDNTESIIQSFSDRRIVYIRNPGNNGLIYSLNRMIGIAGGKYIARMDADDICHPERLATQSRFLDENEYIAALGTTIGFINDQGENTGTWDLDRKTVTPRQIRKQMPYENCIAHPTVMIRSEVIKAFGYKPYQVNIEDYDLWLRMLSRGYVIGKINSPLLLYRKHDSSVTNLYLKKKNVFFKHFHMKRKFLTNEIFSSGRINGFILIVIISAILDIVKGCGKELKNLFK